MAAEQFILIVYDISNDRRRTRLHDVLLNYGTPVQYSVFECLLKPADIAQMRKAVRRVIRPRTDQVRYYFLCKDCIRRTEVTSGAEVLQPAGPSIIVDKPCDAEGG
jgi:CRISPR-associated protein Cas2